VVRYGLGIVNKVPGPYPLEVSVSYPLAAFATRLEENVHCRKLVSENPLHRKSGFGEYLAAPAASHASVRPMVSSSGRAVARVEPGSYVCSNSDSFCRNRRRNSTWSRE
jgi:hypothetical protein